ncbi:hypothetical protein RRG08_038283 [Elysia crispata]|uniref:Uncharacterized protein n=1 Tax=Elysia crispata TaxID=231223 RepID=A0AAE1AMX6_9GAST|nr:hypothetical protein RRG08_038283 [Elysia crispata]
MGGIIQATEIFKTVERAGRVEKTCLTKRSYWKAWDKRYNSNSPSTSIKKGLCKTSLHLQTYLSSDLVKHVGYPLMLPTSSVTQKPAVSSSCLVFNQKSLGVTVEPILGIEKWAELCRLGSANRLFPTNSRGHFTPTLVAERCWFCHQRVRLCVRKLRPPEVLKHLDQCCDRFVYFTLCYITAHWIWREKTPKRTSQPLRRLDQSEDQPTCLLYTDISSSAGVSSHTACMRTHPTSYLYHCD